jgi:AraC-like DNA-binding protein
MYRELRPPAALAPFVECLWRHELSEPGTDASGVVLPDGRTDIVWIAGEEPVLAGPQTRQVPRPLEPPFRAFGVRFRVGAGPRLLRVPAHELVDRHVPLTALDTRPAAALGERLARPGHGLDSLARALLELSEPDGALDPLVGAATRLLDRTDATVHGVARELVLSDRQMQRRFRESVGYAPKTLQRVLRFRRFLGSLAPEGSAGLAWIAASAGYADQAHLSRESRELSGLTPVELSRLWGV